MTLGEVREQIENAANSAKARSRRYVKADYAEIMMNRCLVEEDDYDMLVMGADTGQRMLLFCKWSASGAQVQKLTPNYKYMVVDNEAGMEHISRGILPKVDTVILVSDCSRRGVQAVGRIAGLVKECGLNPKQIGLIVNRAPEGKLNDGTKKRLRNKVLHFWCRSTGSGSL